MCIGVDARAGLPNGLHSTHLTTPQDPQATITVTVERFRTLEAL